MEDEGLLVEVAERAGVDSSKKGLEALHSLTLFATSVSLGGVVKSLSRDSNMSTISGMSINSGMLMNLEITIANNES